MEIVPSIEQLLDAARVLINYPAAHFVLIDAILFIAVILFWIRLGRIGKDVKRVRWRTRQLNETVQDIEYRLVFHTAPVEQLARLERESK